jgi:hypothetical protein
MGMSRHNRGRDDRDGTSGIGELQVKVLDSTLRDMVLWDPTPLLLSIAFPVHQKLLGRRATSSSDTNIQEFPNLISRPLLCLNGWWRPLVSFRDRILLVPSKSRDMERGVNEHGLGEFETVVV